MTLLDAANYAEEAYHDGAFDPHRWESYHRASDTRMIVQCKGDLLVAAVRGTTSWPNWRSNFSFHVKGGIHAGVSDIADYHEGTLKQYMQTHKYSDFILVGHSLGGSVATELARRFKTLSVTFGAYNIYRDPLPEVDNIRVVHNNDVVTRLLGWRFKPVGELIYFNRHGRIGRRTAWDMFLGRIENPWFDGIADHYMERYVKLSNANNFRLKDRQSVEAV